MNDIHRLPTITDPATGRVYPYIAGGNGDDTDALLARLESDSDPLSDEELDALEEELLAEFDDVDGEQPDIERMEAIADQIASVRGVRAERAEAAAADQARAEEIRSQIHVVDDVEDEADDDEGGDDDSDEEAGDEDEEADAPVATGDDEGDDGDDRGGGEEADDEGDEVEQPVSQVASTPRPPLRSARRPASHAPQPRRRQSNPTTIVAAGDIPGVSAGAHIPDLQRVGEAFAAKAAAVMGSRGARGRYPVASFQVEFPEERRLDSNPQVNEERIEAVLASLTQDAIVAAGGLCAPVDVSYDVDNISTDRRPLRDSLTRFGADRGGIRFIAPPQLSDINVDVDGTYAADDDTAVALWSEATDREPGENVKPIQTITCGEETEVLVDAITKGLKVGNFNRRFFPEQFRAWWDLAGAAHARTAETRLWNRMVALSTEVSTGELLGAARDILENVDQAVAAFRSRHRMSDNAPLRMQFPEWTRDLMRADLTRQMAGDQTMAVTNEQIVEWFRVRNVNVTWLPDAGQVFGSQGSGALNRWPDTVTALLYPDGHFLHLDGGQLDLGMEIRDSTLNRTNDVEAFTETFENVAFVGVESLAITFDVVPSGTASGTTDIDPSVSGS